MFPKLCTLAASVLVVLAIAPASSPAVAQTPDSAVAAAPSVADVEALARYREAEALAAAHLATFDTLDFEVYSNQQWDRLTESHSPDIVVHWPDGRITRGLTQHIEDVKAQFTWAPDSRVEEHPIRIANGDWTAVTGIVLGTFTLPMHMPDGQVIQPTGKAFRLPVVTLGHWVGGVMDEEYLFWDNAAFLAQIGLGQ